MTSVQETDPLVDQEEEIEEEEPDKEQNKMVKVQSKSPIQTVSTSIVSFCIGFLLGLVFSIVIYWMTWPVWKLASPKRRSKRWQSPQWSASNPFLLQQSTLSMSSSTSLGGVSSNEDWTPIRLST